MTEQLILGEMLKALIEDSTGLKVELTLGVGGGTAQIHPAVVKGEFDLYPEYTGTAWAYVLKKTGLPPENELYRQLTGEYEAQYGLEWVGLYGFNNSYGLAVNNDLAAEHGLKTYSDLAPLTGPLTFGGEYDFFEREDGFEALSRTYGFNFARKVDMDLALKYSAMEKGEIDVMNIFTTDGQLAGRTVTVLEDDKNFYPTYYCGTVVRKDTLAKHPGLRPALMKMDGLLDDAQMAALNYQVDLERKEPRLVAREFLAQKGLISAEGAR